MADIVKMFTSGFWRYVVAWLLPCAAFLGGLLLTIYASVKSLPLLRSVDSAAHGNSALGLIIFSGVTLGMSAVLALSYEPIYRLWEGYTWPERLFILGRRKEVERFRSLRKNRNRYLKQTAEAGDEEGPRHLAAYYSTRRDLLGEKAQQFPEYEEDFLPTRLGNGLRAAERYGYDRYGLDTQTLWYELGSATPENMAEELNAARGVVDFFISAATLGGFYALIAVIAALAKQDLVFACYALIALAISRATYLRAARGTGSIARAQRAIVNVSRKDLANLFGLMLPDDIDEEREMWRAIKEFVVDGRSEALGKWRKHAALDQQAEPEEGVVIHDPQPAAGLPRERGIAG